MAAPWYRVLEENPRGDRPIVRGMLPVVSTMAVDARGERGVVVAFISDGQNSYSFVQARDFGANRPGPVLVMKEDVALFCTSAPLVPGTDLVAVPLTWNGVSLCARATGEEVVQCEDDDGYQNVALGPDGAVVAAGSCNGRLALWDRATGRRLARIAAHRAQICGLAWQPGGDIVATSGEDGLLRLWSARALLAAGDGGEKGPSPQAEAKLDDMLYAVAFAPDGEACAVGTAESGAYLVRAADGAILHHLEGHDSEVLQLAFHPRTGHLVTVSMDASLRVWDPRSGECLFSQTFPLEERGEDEEEEDELFNHDYEATGGLTALAFDPEGTALLLAQDDGTLRQWRLPADG